jgi:hypothetical protein
MFHLSLRPLGEYFAAAQHRQWHFGTQAFIQTLDVASK